MSSFPAQQSLQNRLLALLSPEAYALLRPGLEHLPLAKGHVLIDPGQLSPWAFFPESGLVSVVSRPSSERQLEIGVFGREGMGSVALLLGAGTSPHAVYVQVAGHGHRVPAAMLTDAMARNAELRELLLRYVQSFIVQISQTALCNGSYTIEERLARWLLVVHDRIDSDDLPLTHEFLSIMLGVRRTGVTLAIHMLEGAHMIRARRGLLTITSREKLEEAAAEGYGVAESEYARLIGPLRPPQL